jgi:Kef-type K+ transport system membrane component KefB
MENQMRPIVHLFTPIFFVMVGLSLNFQVIDWSSSFIWIFSGLMFVLAVAGKMLGSFLIRENMPTRLAIGLAMVPRGEVGLIFAELGRSSGIFDGEIYAAMVVVIALTTLLPPFVMKWLYRRHAGSFPDTHG